MSRPTMPGIMTFSLDGAGLSERSMGTRRRSSTTFEATLTSIAVATSGMHTLRVRTDAKNAASSNFFGYLVWLRLVKQ